MTRLAASSKAAKVAKAAATTSVAVANNNGKINNFNILTHS